MATWVFGRALGRVCCVVQRFVGLSYLEVLIESGSVVMTLIVVETVLGEFSGRLIDRVSGAFCNGFDLIRPDTHCRCLVEV